MKSKKPQNSSVEKKQIQTTVARTSSLQNRKYMPGMMEILRHEFYEGLERGIWKSKVDAARYLTNFANKAVALLHPDINRHTSLTLKAYSEKGAEDTGLLSRENDNPEKVFSQYVYRQVIKWSREAERDGYPRIG